jgi:PTH1 family peptidyl-tRNA hydrolase
MKIIIWLGNPGREYAHTRHNIGFIIVDILQKTGFDVWEDSKWKGVIGKWKIWNQDILLLKPTTYMNLSGDAVTAIVNFYKCDPKTDILVISDDIDMEFGKVRYRTQWSHGGQNGLRDIITKLGTSEFARIKIGIGRHDHMSVSDWVLSKLSSEELSRIEGEIYDEVEKKIEEWVILQ